MNKNTVTKVIKVTAIVGAVYATAELFFQLGKGDMLGTMKTFNMTTEEVYKLMTDYIGSGDGFWIKQRFKLMKFATDFNTKDKG